MFEQLEQLAADMRTKFGTEGLSIAYVKCKPTSNPAAYFDIDTDKVIARATVWESLDVDLEAIEVASQRNVIAESHQVANTDELLALLSEYFVRIKELV